MDVITVPDLFLKYNVFGVAIFFKTQAIRGGVNKFIATEKIWNHKQKYEIIAMTKLFIAKMAVRFCSRRRYVWPRWLLSSVHSGSFQSWFPYNDFMTFLAASLLSWMLFEFDHTFWVQVSCKIHHDKMVQRISVWTTDAGRQSLWSPSNSR